MKNILFAASAILFFNLFAASPTSAQDQIFYKTGDEQEAKVLEISATEVKFKKWDNLAGPTHTISKTDVWIIKYENGTKELVYKQTAAAQQTEPAEAAPVVQAPAPEPQKSGRPERPRASKLEIARTGVQVARGVVGIARIF